MSNSLIMLLKVLVHEEIRVEEISKYINLDPNTIERNIQTLNQYLKDRGIKPVEKNKNIYYLDKENIQVEELFSKLDILSSEERQNILCIKLLLRGEINLEKERKKIGVSRTTILKDFKVVKEFLKNNGIETESKNSKGIFLKVKDSEDIRIILCEKIMKLFIDRDSLSKQRKELLNEINTLDEKKCLYYYKKINDILKLEISNFSFYAIYSMALIEEHKKIKIEYKKLKNASDENEQKKIGELIKDILPENLNEYLKEFIILVFYSTKKHSLEGNGTDEKYNKFCEKLFSIFKIEEKEKKKLSKYLKKYFIIGYLNRRFNNLWFRSMPNSKFYIKMIEVVESILENVEVEMLYADILRLTSHFVTFLVRKNLNENLKIVGVYRGINIIDKEEIDKYIKSMYQNLDYNWEPLLYFRFKTDEEIDSYDLIISDTENYSRKNLRKVCNFSIFNIENALQDYVLEKHLKIVENQTCFFINKKK